MSKQNVKSESQKKLSIKEEKYQRYLEFRKLGHGKAEIMILLEISEKTYNTFRDQADDSGIQSPSTPLSYKVKFEDDLCNSFKGELEALFGKATEKGRAFRIEHSIKDVGGSSPFVMEISIYLPPDGFAQEKNSGSIANVDGLAPASDDNLDDDDDSGQDVD